MNKLGSGKDWLGQSLTGPSSSFTYVNVLPGLVANDVIRYRYSLVAHDETTPQFTVRDGGVTLGTYYLPSVAGDTYASAGVWRSSGTSSLANGTSQFTVAFFISEQRFRSLDRLDRDCLSAHALGCEQLSAIPLARHHGRCRVPASAVLRDADDLQRHRLCECAVAQRRQRFVYVSRFTHWRVGQRILRSRIGLVEDAFRRSKIANQNLHGNNAAVDFIIVTSSEFKPVADRLKAYREQPSAGGLNTIVVDVSQIYNEFSSGVPDISAIRDFLKYAYDTWTPRPTFVLFFGGASYDYKGILGAKSSYVPTWQSAESRHDVNSYATDDFFPAFGSDMSPSLVSGRISSRTLAEANTVVDKIIRYEDQSSRDSWRTRMLFVADDAWNSETGDDEGTMHSDDAEAVSNPGITPDELEKKKIYIAEYPTGFTSQGRRKPGAAQDIIDNINQGMLMVNYSGHGNPSVWAHESIFEVNTSIPKLLNADRLSVFVVATCNFSQFDDPSKYTGSELLMNKPDGGASGVISASRKVYQGGNAALNQGTNRRMFSRDAYGRLVVERPATALFLYKASVYNSDNDQKFFFMGDPTLRLAYPRGFASIDSINGQSVDSVGGVPRAIPIALKALSRVTVVGTVRDPVNKPDTTFQGTLSLRVNDVSRVRTIVNFYPGYNWQYLASGGTIYKGENSVASGRFRASFIVPKDISYGDSAGRGGVMAYLSRPEGDGAGFTNAIRISGTDSTAIADHEGPTIRIALDNRSFRAGDVVSEHPTLIVDLRDSSGINTSTAGIGHRIEGWINNSVQSRDLTDSYTSTRDNFREGTVQMQLTGLQFGRNSIRVRAWDSYNNSATAETYFQVASSDQLSIGDLFNYPNPFAG